MALHSDETVNLETTIKAANGQLVKPKTVFAYSIKLLKEEALKKCGGGSTENAEQMMLALETEAAAIFCQERNMSDFQSSTGTRSVDANTVLKQTHTKLLLDIGA
ncbi:Heat shock 70 kDa protein 12A [Desmophyllum pertusum]|uniref:Heat shock 70 kDa protein 12A n=1 Tax=Desmophyllum pertusum TaxID=174260 RepID=A0A9X0CJT1_9CNID|nr:Heat shock 70 kDa protein 12A [Desmophyllum pertusum]